jgi:DNA topoisomerase-1
MAVRKKDENGEGLLGAVDGASKSGAAAAKKTSPSKPRDGSSERSAAKSTQAKAAPSAKASKKPDSTGSPEAEAKEKAKSPKPKSKAAKGEKTLVIVESPAKAKTIEKYLGSKYSVMASMGHLIDLPKSRLGVDTERGFEPEYLTIRGKAKLLKELQKAASKSVRVLLASDNDREGEAIAYHIRNSLLQKNPGMHVERIAFNEITPQAIRDAVKAPHDLDEAKVAAQKARRILDRVVGYNLSPLLWKKVKNGLSAGRVQSVALRLICEREREVESFVPEEYWTLGASFKKGRAAFEGDLAAWQGKKPELKRESDVSAIVTAIEGEEFRVAEVKESEKIAKPKPPFTTSKLQQAAANRLGFTSKKTMQVAQQLYEGVNIGSTRIGIITYMRTDSVRVSQTALDEVREFVGRHFPAELPPEPNTFETQGKAQDAHEAIRPTVVGYEPDAIKESLTKDQYKLYALIWERFVSSQMTNAKIRISSIDVASGEAVFRVSSSRIVEKGFYKALKVSTTKEDKDHPLPEMKVGEVLKCERLHPEQHFTQGPARYSDASIIKILEERGIGRPSTYAPIISVLLERYYVTRENKQLKPTTLGRIINDMLVESFPEVVNADFTADMETRLDRVEEGEMRWAEVLSGFYGNFKAKVDEVMASLESYRGKLDESTDIVCEKCGKPMVKKLGRFGFFLACSGFPECRNTRSIPLARCPRPDCGGEIVARRKQKGKGREFYGCTNYPECDFVTYYKPTNTYCPKCGHFLVERFDKKNGSYKACINPECDYLHAQDAEAEGEAKGAALASEE